MLLFAAAFCRTLGAGSRSFFLLSRLSVLAERYSVVRGKKTCYLLPAACYLLELQPNSASCYLLELQPNSASCLRPWAAGRRPNHKKREAGGSWPEAGSRVRLQFKQIAGGRQQIARSSEPPRTSFITSQKCANSSSSSPLLQARSPAPRILQYRGATSYTTAHRNNRRNILAVSNHRRHQPVLHRYESQKQPARRTQSGGRSGLTRAES